MTKEFKYLKEGLTSDLVQFLMKDFNLDISDRFHRRQENAGGDWTGDFV